MTMKDGKGRLDLEQAYKLVESYRFRSDLVGAVCDRLCQEIENLTVKLKVATEALEQIKSRAAMVGYDSGDSAVYEISSLALCTLDQTPFDQPHLDHLDVGGEG